MLGNTLSTGILGERTARHDLICFKIGVLLSPSPAVPSSSGNIRTYKLIMIGFKPRWRSSFDTCNVVTRNASLTWLLPKIPGGQVKAKAPGGRIEITWHPYLLIVWQSGQIAARPFKHLSWWTSPPTRYRVVSLTSSHTMSIRVHPCPSVSRVRACAVETRRWGARLWTLLGREANDLQMGVRMTKR